MPTDFRIRTYVGLILAITQLRTCQISKGSAKDLYVQTHMYAKSCGCSGITPCQHGFDGDFHCYQLIAHPGGSSTCPAETTHCRCPCQDKISPCHNLQNTVLVGESKPRQCLDTYVMFGQSVCPAGSVHCQKHVVAETNGAPTAPTPAPLHEECGFCTIETPCRDLRMIKKNKKVLRTNPGRQCTVGVDGSCPTGTTMCVSQAHLTPQCICGGGRPCQSMRGSECFEKGLTDAGG
jgi:hypothetical protein